MQCISAQQVVELFGPQGFSVVSNPIMNRMTLRLEANFSSREKRIGGRPTPHAQRLVKFVEALNRWLPTDQVRLLWVDHSDSAFPSTHALFVAARAGLGELRSIVEAPGHLFESFPYSERDQLRMLPEQTRQTGILIGLTLLVIMNGWDGWLLSGQGVDRIEFWEGNLFFYSGDKERLDSAKVLMDQFECTQDLV
jgi:hypothetical protein